MENTWKSFSELCSRKDRQISELIHKLKGVEDECEALEQRYKHILQNYGTPGKDGFKVSPREIGGKGDSDSSLEFDEHFQRVDTRKERKSASSEEGECDGEAETKPETSKARITSLLPPESSIPISAQLVTQILDENRRLQFKIKDTIRQWCKDNDTGLDSITKLGQDVVQLRAQLAKNNEPDFLQQLEEEKLKVAALTEDNAILKEQIVTFTEDFKNERRERETAVARLKDTLEKFAELQKQNRALREANNRIKAERAMHMSSYPTGMQYPPGPVYQAMPYPQHALHFQHLQHPLYPGMQYSRMDSMVVADSPKHDGQTLDPATGLGVLHGTMEVEGNQMGAQMDQQTGMKRQSSCPEARLPKAKLEEAQASETLQCSRCRRSYHSLDDLRDHEEKCFP